MRIQCPQCQLSVETTEDGGQTCSACGAALPESALPESALPESALPESGVAANAGPLSPESSDAPTELLGEDSLCLSGLGRYKLVRQIGVGGFGIVYEAMDEILQRPVALKVARSEKNGARSRNEAALREAQLAARLNHPHIVHIYDVGENDETDECFIAMEYVDGPTLHALAKAARLAPRRAVEICAQVARALQHAHVAGLVHRDIKPGNILIDREGRARVTDFGIALDEAQQLASAGEVSGTFNYMSPEQVRGETHRLDGRSDIWSLGVVLYELLVGRRPFQGDRKHLVSEILSREPKPLRQIDEQIPEELERITLQCLAKPIASRYATAADVARDLERWLAGNAVVGVPESSSSSERIPVTETAVEVPQRSPGTKPLRAATRRWRFVALFVGVALSLGAGLYPSVLAFRRMGASDPPARRDYATPRSLYHLLQSPPTSRILPVGSDPEVAFHDRSLQSFVVQSPDHCGFAFGTTPELPCRLKLTMRKAAAYGESGFFVGLRRDPANGPDTWICQAVTLLCFTRGVGDDVMRISRHFYQFRQMGDRLHRVFDRVPTSVDVETVHPPQGTLEVELRNQHITCVSWNGRILPALIDDPDLRDFDPSCRGEFGLLNCFGPVVFSECQMVTN